jgi:hypothetical protein
VASGALDPITNPGAYDFPLFNGQVCPGWADVRGFKRVWAWDKKIGKGVQGHTLTYTGSQPVEGEIEFFLTEPEDFQNWESFRPLFQYNPTLQPVQVLKIQHPFLQDLGVISFVAKEIGQIEHRGQNLFSVVVKFAEFVKPPPAPAVGTPNGAAKQPPNTTQPPSPQDPLQQKIASLFSEFQAP